MTRKIVAVSRYIRANLEAPRAVALGAARTSLRDSIAAAVSASYLPVEPEQVEGVRTAAAVAADKIVEEHPAVLPQAYELATQDWSPEPAEGRREQAGLHPEAGPEGPRQVRSGWPLVADQVSRAPAESSASRSDRGRLSEPTALALEFPVQSDAQEAVLWSAAKVAGCSVA